MILYTKDFLGMAFDLIQMFKYYHSHRALARHKRGQRLRPYSALEF